ncbi:SDR family oxidoreductase [Ponticaulis sp.]|uniref:SDR family oxidoreductase n=1 Tax=Ponticaulis sp. TaxID=2020902 RepID=UPI000B74B346|nr:SDR family oxidoreductase [Ponticaulis sp.]MAI91246.1 short-chain dehydrogenase [Ponticaulis sp.]OUX98557.1 MAG: short-chain dehydrogenase [Hyphomonadaceae bacterium TMED5]|tara:strand:- start:33419 stop:34174 length:756 start_codon:yes stop_codon:yes gene_type:complete
MSKDIAVVVGAGGEIGQFITEALINAGQLVIGVGRSEASNADLTAKFDTDCFRPLIADIGDDSSIEAIAAALDAPVSMVVHSAGVPVAGGVKNVATDAVLNACNLKINGFIRLVRGVEGRLRTHSRLVAIGGHYGFEPSPYAATAGVGNAALANLMRQMNWAYGPQGITAHMVAPGPADTARMRRVADDRAKAAGSTGEAELEKVRSESAIGQLTDPKAVGWACASLLAPEADAMAGSTMFLDAGRRKGLP